MLDRLPGNSDVIQTSDSEAELEEKVRTNGHRLLLIFILSIAGAALFFSAEIYTLGCLSILIAALVAWYEPKFRARVVKDHEDGK